MIGHRVEPERHDFTESQFNRLWLPDGFRTNLFAQGLRNPRMIAIAPDGTIYITPRAQNDVVALYDRDDDGHADEIRVVISNLDSVHGITIHQNRLYLVTVKELYVADRRQDGSVSPLRLLINDLPGGDHLLRQYQRRRLSRFLCS